MTRNAAVMRAASACTARPTIGVELVRQMRGVVLEERASAGILVTTSRFTSGAYDLARRAGNISLNDYQHI